MDCTTLERIFAGDEEQDLDVTASRQLEEHLDDCAGCRERLAQAEDELTPLVERYEPPVPSDAAWERVTRAVREEATAAPVVAFPSRRRASQRTIPLLLAAAAALLVALGVSIILPQTQGPQGGVDNGGVSTLPPADLTPPEPRPGTDVVELPQPAVVERLEAGEGFEAGTVAVDDLLCVWVRETD